MGEIRVILRTVLLICLVAVAAIFAREFFPVGSGFAAFDDGEATAEASANASVYAATESRARRYSVLFNDIGPVPYNEPATLVASIATKSEEEAFAAVSRGNGPPRKGSAKFTNYVRAHLSGPSGFVTIDGDGSSVQMLSNAGNATWTWQVVPKTLRPTRLTLRFFNSVEKDGQLYEVPGPTYTATIKVTPNWSSRARDLADEYQGVIAVIGIVAPIITGICGFLFGRWWDRRSSAAKPKPGKKTQKGGKRA